MGGPAGVAAPRRRARRRRPGQEVVRQQRRFHPRREVGRAQALPQHLHRQVDHRRQRRRPEADEARQEPVDQGPDQDRAVARRDRLPLHVPPPRHQRFQDAESLAQVALLHPPQDRAGLRPHRGEQGGPVRSLHGPHPAPADEGARRVRAAERRQQRRRGGGRRRWKPQKQGRVRLAKDQPPRTLRALPEAVPGAHVERAAEGQEGRGRGEGCNERRLLISHYCRGGLATQ
mmetsp:Transcript_16919/g.40106  ORF Transcript_16919/g.40106 Transcript_16919/m.40106 type:complete len:231 (-) Transcript_16919:92-784(-)